MTFIELKTGRPLERTCQQGAVKFTRMANGMLQVVGNPRAELVAEAIRRAKAKAAWRRSAIGSEKARVIRGRMAEVLDRIE